MPELPEVESARFLIETHCLNHTISQVITKESGGGPRHGIFDDIVFDCKDGHSEQDFISMLLNNKLIGVKRKGKQLWFVMADNDGSSKSSKSSSENSKSCLFHFGMTGSFVIQGEIVPQYKSFKIEEEVWPPRFCKCEIIFSNGKRMAFCDPRRLGRIRLRGSAPENSLPISKLAADPTQKGGIDTESFISKVQGYNSSIKAVLLDQEKVVSGIGNWIADEVLYQCNIHPETVCKTIPRATLTTLARSIKSICIEACECTTSNKRFPDHYLFHYRWVKGKGTVAKDYYGSSITFITAGGRTSAVVLQKQKKSFGNGDGGDGGVKEEDNAVVESSKKGKTGKPVKKSKVKEESDVSSKQQDKEGKKESKVKVKEESQATSSKYFNEEKEERKKRKSDECNFVKVEIKPEKGTKKKKQRKG